MNQVKKFIRKYTPEILLIAYHSCNAFLASLWYRFPARAMHVIGITGTKGKTSTANFIWSVLDAGNIQAGLIGTANIRIGKIERINRYHMTMPNPWILQKTLREMVEADCTHIVMEVTSEGLKYNRHIGIPFEIAVFTNLSPEHLGSHQGNFEIYKRTKGKLFSTLQNNPKSVAIINTDSEHGAFYVSYKANRHITYGITSGEIKAEIISDTQTGVVFRVNHQTFVLHTLGVFNIYNALPAISIGHIYGIHENLIAEGLANLSVIPGRMEEIKEGQPYTVIVDYAHEKLSINTLLDTVRNWCTENQKIIVVIGAEGGGRDKAKCEHMGRAAGIKADYVIVTTTDPYDDDPETLAETVTHFVELAGKERGKTVFMVIDRREGIKKALSLASAGDYVLLTGMGAQETMIVAGKALPWNERAIVRELIKQTFQKNI